MDAPRYHRDPSANPCCHNEEFADFDIAGARVDRIAQRAQADKRAIYEQSGDKSELFTIVLFDA
jgi:AcrR family transcriptional regulator